MMNVLRRQPPQQRPFDVTQLEKEVEQAVMDTPEFLPRRPPEQPRQRDTRPPVLLEQPMVSAEDLGRITGEAIKAAHEAAATALDTLGKEIAERIARIEQLKAQSLQQIKDCQELAAQHRDAGKLMSVQVESAAADMAEARDMIEAMRKKVSR